MRRLTSVAVALVLSAVASGAAQETQEKKFGAALTLTEVTVISAIYASPDQFNGQRVQVQGPIVDVCSEKGCWLALGSDKEPQTLRFKVDEGVIVFPMSVKGMKAKVEGVVVVTKGPGPGIKIEIKGEGAIVY